MQTPSSIFNTLRERSGNHITQKCVIELGNYALSSKGASAEASSEFSDDWPASGVVDGDRTHINAGAASVAENGIGQSVWQGSTLADGAGNISEYIILDLGSVRTVNRIKIIFWPDSTKNMNLGSIGAKDFTIGITEDGTGYGLGPYGGGGYGGLPLPAWTGLVDKCAEIGKAATAISGGAVTGNVNDMVVFEDPTPQSVQFVEIAISKLQSGSVRARIVAIELTMAVDVSDSVAAASRQRKKDYHLDRRQASLLQLTLRDLDGRYNDRITPTAAQTTAGFFNSSIRPNLEVRYFGGFSGVNAQMFSGFIDSWDMDAEARIVKVSARDFYKFLVKPKISTKQKLSKSLEFLVELVANYQNFPSNLMILDMTTIAPTYFMPSEKSVQQVLNDLLDATGSAEIYFDEFGRLNFRSYLTIIKHIWFQGSAADFQGGTNVNNTDATTVPGALILSGGGTYPAEGNWYSALSPVFDGKVEFDDFQASYSTGPATSIDFFLRVTNDGGATFTPWREVIPGPSPRGLISKWNEWYTQIQVWARLRSSNTTQTPQLLDFTVNYTSRGGSVRVSATADWASKDVTTLMGLQRRLTDSLGGVNYMVSRAIVKSNPTFASAGSVTAWQGTYNGEAVSASNPMFVPVGVTTLVADFGQTQYAVPQTINITYGTAVAVATLSSDPSKPTLTITVTVAGTITALTISGFPFTQNGTVQAISDAPQDIKDDYGVNESTLTNDYIDNVRLAESIADNIILQFGQGPLDWIPEARIRFSPNAQLNDRVTITDRFSGLADDYAVIGLTDEISISGSSKTFAAKTAAELVKIGAGATLTEAAHYGSAGIYYFDNFRFGGDYRL